jgi:excisionase family DNA binding protein
MEKMVYTLAEAAQILGFSKRTMGGFVKSGALKPVLMGGQYRISAQELQRFIAEGTGETSAKFAGRGRKPYKAKPPEEAAGQAAGGPEIIPESARDAIDGVAGVRRVDQPGGG